MFKPQISTIVATLCILTYSAVSFAKVHQVEVQLVELEAKKTVRAKGDKLYFSITVYPSDAEPSVLRVPMYPEHWLSKELTGLKNVTLWEGKIDDEKSVELIFSLMKQDIPLIDPDDHLGSAKVKIINHDDKIAATWGQPKFVDQPKVEEKPGVEPEYLMFGHKGEYEVKFKLNVID